MNVCWLRLGGRRTSAAHQGLRTKTSTAASSIALVFIVVWDIKGLVFTDLLAVVTTITDTHTACGVKNALRYQHHSATGGKIGASARFSHKKQFVIGCLLYKAVEIWEGGNPQTTYPH